MDQKQLSELVPYKVKKVFTKPVKIDALFTTLSELLGVSLKIDNSPGIVEVHVNDDIVFIELAQGLNRDKIDLLHFKIMELIKLYEILVPKVIVMLSDMKLSIADVTNLEKLFSIVTKASKAKHKFIKILTNDEFVHRFIKDHEEYAGIKVVSNLHDAVEDLLTELDSEEYQGEKKAELIGDKVLSADNSVDEEAMLLKFDTDSGKSAQESIKESVQNLRIATVDDDFIIRELIRNSFQGTGAEVKTFSDGEEFLSVVDTEEFDLVFLDLIMPKMDGFAVLNQLQAKEVKYPIIVLSSVTERDTVIRAFNMGIKSYLIKPLKPQDIFKKSMEILKPGF
jgi:CheY-like chemotaxis protein